MSFCYLALGGNVGDIPQTFDRALDRLHNDSRLRLTGRSSLYRSRPMGADAGAAYLNAVAEFETTLSPHDLLAEVQQVECEFGRVRTITWGPRTLDLDLLYLGEVVLETPSLVLPHRHAWYRRFVLRPMVELAPEVRHPLWGETQSELLARIDRRPLPVVLDDVDAISAAQRHELEADFADVAFRRGRIQDGAGELVVRAQAPACASDGPAVNLSEFHLAPAAALRAVLEAALGECDRVEA